jgi:hypothetical protein
VKYVETHPLSNPETAARKPFDIANGVEAVQWRGTARVPADADPAEMRGRFEVIAFDSGGIMQGGTNGIKCWRSAMPSATGRRGSYIRERRRRKSWCPSSSSPS